MKLSPRRTATSPRCASTSSPATRARTSVTLVEHRPAARRGHVHERDRLRAGRSRRSSSRSRSPKDTTYVTSYYAPRATSRSAPATSRTRSGRARSPRLPPATGSTSTPRRHRSRPTRGTRRTTGSTPCSARARPRTRTRAAASAPSRRPTERRSSAASTHPTVTFNEAMTASTVNATTITLKNDLNASVTSTVAYDAATRTATLTPSAPLALGRSYTITVAGGSAGVKDGAGNAAAADFSATFSTPALCPCSVFKSTEGAARRRPGRLARRGRHEVPLQPGRLDHGPALLQAAEQHRHARRPPVVRRRPAAGRGHVHATRRRPAGRSATSPTPVQITKDTTYVTSYYAAGGRFAFSPGFFTGRRRTGRRCTRRPTARRRQRRLPLRPERLPGRDVRRDQLLGRRDSSSGTSRRTSAPPDTLFGQPRAERHAGVAPSSKVEIDVRRGRRSTDREHRLDHARDGRRRRRSRRRSPTTTPRTRSRSRRRRRLPTAPRTRSRSRAATRA